uniref:DDB1- and CUL4-associated factor 11 n=1 Tax=Timema douglasi TaxID=61478 RepID=A0A7R8VXV1_TIMDO|nr:unnamed protein product [Timema douglasi]
MMLEMEMVGRRPKGRPGGGQLIFETDIVNGRKLLINPRKNLDGDTSIMTYRGHKVLQTLIRCHFSPEFTTGQRFIYTGCAAGRVVIYDMLTGKVKAALPGHSACVRDVSWHPYRTEIISSGWDGMLGRWTYTGKKVYDYVPSGAPMETNPPSDQSEPTSPVTLRRSRRIAQQQQQQQTQQQQPQSTARRRDGPSKKTTSCARKKEISLGALKFCAPYEDFVYLDENLAVFGELTNADVLADVMNIINDSTSSDEEG